MTLKESDPKIFDLIQQEKHRQETTLELIAKEVMPHFGRPRQDERQKRSV